MSKDKQKETDTKISENSVNEILFDDENTKDLESKPKKSKRLTISSTQEAGTGSSGDRLIISNEFY